MLCRCTWCSAKLPMAASCRRSESNIWGAFLLTDDANNSNLIQHTVGTIPDMPNIHNIMTNIGHRFHHQSGLDESSGRNSITCLHGIVFRVCLKFSKIRKNPKRHSMCYCIKLWFAKNVVLQKKKKKCLRQAWNEVSWAWGCHYICKCHIYIYELVCNLWQF